MTVCRFSLASEVCCALLAGLVGLGGCNREAPAPTEPPAAKSPETPVVPPTPPKAPVQSQSNAYQQAPITGPIGSGTDQRPAVAFPSPTPEAVAPSRSTARFAVPSAPESPLAAGKESTAGAGMSKTPGGLNGPMDVRSPGGPAVVTDPLAPPVDNAPPMLFGGERAIVPAAKEPATTRGPAASAFDLGPRSRAAERGQPQRMEGIGQPAPLTKPLVERNTEILSTQATVEKSSTGDPVLSIKAAWKGLRRPSLQIMLVTDAKADLAKLAPIAIDGSRAQMLWEEQVGKINKPVFPNARDVLKTSMAFLEFNGAQWMRVRARVNSLGRPAAYAVEDKQGTLLVFYLLEHWADDQGTIRIAVTDLDVAVNFAQAGRLKVWLLNEEKVVSTATADWPGKPAPAVTGSSGEKGSKPSASTAKPATPQAEVAKTSVPAASDAKKTASPTPQAPPAAKPAAVAAEKPVAPPQKPEPPKAVSVPPAAPAKPAASSGPPTVDEMKAMSIPDLANSIERNYAGQMNAAVRKSWQGGMRNYFQSDNPESVRRDVFMTLLRACWREQQPGDLRNGFAVLYQKLKDQAGPAAER